MKIKAIIEIIKSKRDVCGNSYWGFTLIDTNTGRRVHGMADHQSNVLNVAALLFPDNAYWWTRREVTKRDFRTETRAWRYAGCKAQEMLDFIEKELFRT